MSDWEREIRELHAFFQGWIGGELDRSPETFRRLEDALADDFTFVTTAGEVLERPAIVEGVRSSHASSSDLRIRIRDPRLLRESAGQLVAVYQELQEAAGGRTGRVSTVVFRRSEAAPNGLEWLHVHETWIEG